MIKLSLKLIIKQMIGSSKERKTGAIHFIADSFPFDSVDCLNNMPTISCFQNFLANNIVFSSVRTAQFRRLFHVFSLHISTVDTRLQRVSLY